MCTSLFCYALVILHTFRVCMNSDIYIYKGHASTLRPQHTQLSVSGTLTVALSLSSLTHGRSSSCPRCHEDGVCFVCQQLHIPDRRPRLFGASKLNMAHLQWPDRALLCHFYCNIQANKYQNHICPSGYSMVHPQKYSVGFWGYLL